MYPAWSGESAVITTGRMRGQPNPAYSLSWEGRWEGALKRRCLFWWGAQLKPGQQVCMAYVDTIALFSNCTRRDNMNSSFFLTILSSFEMLQLTSSVYSTDFKRMERSKLY